MLASHSQRFAPGCRVPAFSSECFILSCGISPCKSSRPVPRGTARFVVHSATTTGRGVSQLSASNANTPKRSMLQSQIASTATPTMAGTSSAVADGQHVVVVGAGPAGCLTAVYLARRGYYVHVYERRSAPKGSAAFPAPGVRSYPMMLSTRATHAFGQLGMQLQCADPAAHPHRGMYIMSSGSALAFDPEDVNCRTVIVDRVGLATDMVHEAQRLYPDRITFHFNAALESVDFEARSARFIPCVMSDEAGNSVATSMSSSGYGKSYLSVGSSGGISSTSTQSSSETGSMGTASPASKFGHSSVITVSEDEDGAVLLNSSVQQQQFRQPFNNQVVQAHYDLIIGADGASSRLRELMQMTLPELDITTTLVDGDGYKSFRDLPILDRDLVEGFSNHKPKEYLYFFSASGAPVTVMWLTEQHTVSGMIVTPPRSRSWEPKALHQLLADSYPLLPREWIGLLVAQVGSDTDQAQSSFGRIVRLSQFHGPRAVLLGDAAHTVTSALGQGCNLALESVRCFDEVLESVGNDLDAAPAAFTAKRQKNAHALQELEFMQKSLSPNTLYPTAFDRFHGAIGRTVMAASILAGVVMWKLLPSWQRSPVVVYEAMRDIRNSYSDVLRIVCVQGASVLVIAAALLATGCQAAWTAFVE